MLDITTACRAGNSGIEFALRNGGLVGNPDASGEGNFPTPGEERALVYEGRCSGLSILSTDSHVHINSENGERACKESGAPELHGFERHCNAYMATRKSGLDDRERRMASRRARDGDTGERLSGGRVTSRLASYARGTSTVTGIDEPRNCSGSKVAAQVRARVRASVYT